MKRLRRPKRLYGRRRSWRSALRRMEMWVLAAMTVMWTMRTRSPSRRKQVKAKGTLTAW